MVNTSRIRCLLLSIPLLAFHVFASAAEPQVITSGQPGFGADIAADGDVLVIGAPSETVDGEDRQGAAYVYEQIDGEWRNTARLTAPDGDERDDFGREVAVDNGVIVVGAAFAATAGVTEAGAAYVFERGTSAWRQSARLTASVPSAAALFGFEIAVGDDRIVVSSPNDGREFGDRGGALYVFHRDGASGWLEAARLKPVSTDATVRSLDVAGDLLVASLSDAQGTVLTWRHDGTAWLPSAVLEAGAHQLQEIRVEGDELAGAMPNAAIPGRPDLVWPGLVHVFARDDDTWQRVTALQAAEPVDEGQFGSAMDMNDGIIAASSGRLVPAVTSLFVKDSAGEWVRVRDVAGYMPEGRRTVAVSGRVLAVGGYNLDGSGGAVNVFDMTELLANPDVPGDGGGDLPRGVQIITPPDAYQLRNIGSAAIHGDELVVTARVNAPGSDDEGAAYVFERDGEAWRFVEKLAPPTGAHASFGRSVALDDEFLVVSAFDENVSGLDGAGAVHVFERADDGGWQYSAQLIAADSRASARFGSAVRMDDGVIAVSAVEFRDADAPIGAIYLFEYDRQRGQWQQIAKHEEPPAYSPAFAYDIDLAGDTLVTGGFGDGAILLYERDATATWRHAGAIDVPSGDDNVFHDLAFDGDVIVAADPESPGHIYVYRRDGAGTWGLRATLESPEAGSAFGASIEVENGIVAATGWRRSDGDHAVHFFRERAGAGWQHVASTRNPEIFSDQVALLDMSDEHLVVKGMNAVFLYALDEMIPGGAGNDGDDNGGGNADGGNGDGDGAAGDDPGTVTGGDSNNDVDDSDDGGGGAILALLMLLVPLVNGNARRR